uniref:Cyclin N-terminal domain-containing protein n=1 Tax=Steinernema glaseri TaxID=37863 RepID=A0A1I7Z700_9BILA
METRHPAQTSSPTQHKDHAYILGKPVIAEHTSTSSALPVASRSHFGSAPSPPPSKPAIQIGLVTLGPTGRRRASASRRNGDPDMASRAASSWPHARIPFAYNKEMLIVATALQAVNHYKVNPISLDYYQILDMELAMRQSMGK